MKHKLVSNKDLEIGQTVVLNDTFKRDYPQGYDQLYHYLYKIRGFEDSGKMFAIVSFHGAEFSWHTAYLRKYR